MQPVASPMATTDQIDGCMLGSLPHAGIGIGFALNQISDDGLFCLDAVLGVGGKVAVEVYDEACFCVNEQQPLGDTVMKSNLLQAYGWQVRW